MLRFLFLLFCVCFIGCSYNFSEDNYIDLQKPTTDGITIILSSFNNGDTINVEKRMFYAIDARPEQAGISTEIFLDGERIASNSKTQSGEFTLRPSLYNDGEHTIRIVHVLSSGTGSIAEQQQLETITVTKDFQFIIHREPSTPPAITSARIENGSITLEWENADNQEFTSAYLSVQFPEHEQMIPLTEAMVKQGTYIDTYTVLFPLDSNRPAREDRSSVVYAVVLESEFETLYGESATLEHDPAWIDVSMSFTDLEHYSLSWPQHPLYANFDAYTITIRTDYSSEPQSITASTQGGTQVVDAPYTFGADYFGTLFPETGHDPYIPSYNFKPRPDEISIKSIPNMDQYFGKNFIFNPATQRYYLLALENNTGGSTRGISIFEYNTAMEFIQKTTLVTLDSRWDGLSFNLEMNPDTNNFYLDVGYRNENFQLIDFTMELDKFSLSKLKEFSAQNLSGAQVLQLRGNILKTWDFQTKQLTLTNVTTNEVFYSLDLQGYNATNVSYLSNDARYIFISTAAEDAIYEIENNTLTKRITLTEPPGYSFAAGAYSMVIHENKLYYASAVNNLKLIDIGTGQITTIAYVAGNNNRTVSYDPIANKLLLIQGEVCFIADPIAATTDRFAYEADKGNSGPGDDYYLWLTNGKLIHSKGIYVDIE